MQCITGTTYEIDVQCQLVVEVKLWRLFPTTTTYSFSYTVEPFTSASDSDGALSQLDDFVQVDIAQVLPSMQQQESSGDAQEGDAQDGDAQDGNAQDRVAVVSMQVPYSLFLPQSYW